MTSSRLSALTHRCLASAFLLAACALPSAHAEPVQPSSSQLAKLCAACEFVTEVHSEKRSGKASGLGVAGGAVAGGVIGHKVGDSTAATVGGAVVGGVVGNAIEKRLKRHTVWVVDVVKRDGSTLRHELDADPHLAAGDVVEQSGKGLKKR